MHTGEWSGWNSNPLANFQKKKTKTCKLKYNKTKNKGTRWQFSLKALTPPRDFGKNFSYPLPGFSTRVFLYFFSTLFVRCTACCCCPLRKCKTNFIFYYIFLLCYSLHFIWMQLQIDDNNNLHAKINHVLKHQLQNFYSENFKNQNFVTFDFWWHLVKVTIQ